jgi:hypothetical protein
MTMNTIRFNTGRKYTAAGQRIVATYRPHNEAEDEGGTVTFFDHDRMVDGEFDISSEMLFNQRTVMDAYDLYNAPSTKRSWQDGLQRGGCNTDLGGLK